MLRALRVVNAAKTYILNAKGAENYCGMMEDWANRYNVETMEFDHKC